MTTHTRPSSFLFLDLSVMPGYLGLTRLATRDRQESELGADPRDTRLTWGTYGYVMSFSNNILLSADAMQLEMRTCRVQRPAARARKLRKLSSLPLPPAYHTILPTHLPLCIRPTCTELPAPPAPLHTGQQRLAACRLSSPTHPPRWHRSMLRQEHPRGDTPATSTPGHQQHPHHHLLWK